jgi:hypothetical protein
VHDGRTGEQQPGAAAVRAYLETLADLPWSRTSADLAAALANDATAAASSASAGASNISGGGSGNGENVNSGSAAGGGAAIGGSGGDSRATSLSHAAVGEVVGCSGLLPHTLGVQLSLRAARTLLDEQHHGLDKIKDRRVNCVSVFGRQRVGGCAACGASALGTNRLAVSARSVITVQHMLHDTWCMCVVDDDLQAQRA